MKRTYWLAEPNYDEHDTFSANRKITCRVVGQWATGSMIWQDDEGGQYYVARILGTNYFVHV